MEKRKWKDCDTQERILRVIGYCIVCLSLLATAFVVAGRWIPAVAASGLYNDLDIFTKREGFNVWLRSLSYTVCIFSIAYAVRKGLTLTFRWVKHGFSLVSLLCSFIKYIAAIIVLFCILAAFGVDTTALLAGLGILSLVVGLAVQPLLQDIIAGLFVVFEKTYDVGDVVVVDTFRGTVVEIGIRTTKLKDAGGDIKVINNSDIRTLINMTGDLSVAISDVDVEYGESLERVEQVLAANLPAIKEKIPAIVDGPYYKGVVALGASGVTLRLVAQCAEGEKFQTQRDMNRQIKLLFDANGISIPFQQVVLHTAKEQAPTASAGTTDAFVREQNEKSKTLDIEDDEK